MATTNPCHGAGHLIEEGPAAGGFDLLFESPDGRGDTEDVAFAEALQRHRELFNI